jgi:hypothetical protein
VEDGREGDDREGDDREGDDREVARCASRRDRSRVRRVKTHASRHPADER